MGTSSDHTATIAVKAKQEAAKLPSRLRVPELALLYSIVMLTWERSKVLVTNGQTKKYLYPNIHVYRISPVWIAVRIVCSLSTMMTLSSPAEMKLKTFINNDRLSSLSEFVSYTAGRSE